MRADARTMVPFCVFCVFLSLQAAVSAVWTVENYPNPQKDLQSCGRNGTRSWICDPNGFLPDSEQNIVEGLLKKIALAKESYSKSPCPSEKIPGFQVAVAIMNETVLDPNIDSKAAATKFAKDLLNKWGVGHSECNDGVLVAMMIENRKIAIATGAGARHLHTRKIIAEMKPYLRTNQYEAAIKRGVYDIGDDLSTKTHNAKFIDFIIPGAFMALVAACMCGSCVRSRRGTNAKEKIEMLKQAEQAVRSGTYEAVSCPICFDRFENPPGNHRDDTSSTSSSDNGHQENLDEWGPLLFKHKNDELNETEHQRLKEKRKLPVTLQCGHSFCEPCLLDWLDHNDTCPICRQSIPNMSDSSSYPNTYSTSQQQWTASTWDPEMQFRLNRLGYLYPSYMTPGMIDMWYMDYRLGRNFEYQNHPDFKALTAAQESNLADFGSSGAAGDFGGGTADGGGGSAGEW
ncbi:hypothetical protein BSKO_06517 [Bryopsis sp. KO-2023]|nr:hypothetical protein BSKO_06517 [Bryopsis sp. KO-2023]